MSNSTSNRPDSAVTEETRPVAVIDVGSSSIRMEVAEIGPDGAVRSLEALQHPVGLGKDVFNSGRVEPETIEACVRVLRGFRRVLQDYGITRDDQIRAVATSSIREASNRETILNRIFIGAHIQVEAIDEAEVNRLTYIAVRDSLEKLGALEECDTVVVEVGGGSTELLLVQDGRVTLSRAYRLGSLRMRETLEAAKTPRTRITSVFNRHIRRTIDQIHRQIPPEPVQRLIAIGGDVRFAVDRLAGSNDPAQRVVTIPVERFAKFARQIMAQSVEELVRAYRITFQEAETIGPALMAYARLAESFSVRELFISRITLRDGLLLEMATRGAWTVHFQQQVTHSAMMLGRKYAYEEPHAVQVAELCGRLFEALQDTHELEPRYELLLRVAALLHEIGSYVGNQSHHKHSLYLIMHSDLFGLSRKDTLLVALVARYHRRAMPKPTHPEYMSLPQSERIIVSKLAALLRVADALDQNHMQQIRELRFLREQGRLVIVVHGVADLTLERLALRQKSVMFEEIFGMKVELRRDAPRKGGGDGG